VRQVQKNVCLRKGRDKEKTHNMKKQYDDKEEILMGIHFDRRDTKVVVTSMNVSVLENTVTITAETKMGTDRAVTSLQGAIELGLINLKAIKKLFSYEK